MKTLAMYGMMFAIGLVVAGCGSQKADKPSDVVPPPPTNTAPADDAAQPAEEPATPPTPDEAVGPEPKMESAEPAEPSSQTEPASEPKPAEARTTPAEEKDKPSGNQSVLGALGKSLINAATRSTEKAGDQTGPAIDDAPGYDKQQ